MSAVLRFLKVFGVVILGTTLIIAGIFMLALPGPGILTIVAGLAVLGTEFETPRRWVAALRRRFNLKRSNKEEPPDASPPVGASPLD